ncbi:hypothetical protein OC846_003560 [Tilletia horrida]|uniref:RecQ-mediated genome instability protein 1 n=1 Tax=Tilletia horrida TaxID=155126 RepID=A0AAN6JTT0_9BASI|nr:hypothetical protein OC845_003832 [Tilletia horrida]KAK0550703.1 hypothetical protein OC846_003560 [Tilletia horrida]
MSAPSATPSVLLSWLRSRYPTFPVRREWLEGCVDYILSDAAASGRPRPSDRELIKQVNLQLLHSDLADSAEAGVLPPDILDIHKKKLGEKSKGVLLQVVGIMDVGVSAQTQLDVLAARQEARSMPVARSSGSGTSLPTQVDRAQDVDGDFDGEDHMAAFQAAEASLAANPTVYPRSLLRLHLSDGHNDELLLPAFEHTRIEGLSMGGKEEEDKRRTLLGCKVLIKDAEIRRGQLLLRPGQVEVLGGSIPELEHRGEYILESSLRLRQG